MVTSRIDAIDGVAAADVKLKNFPRRMLRSINLTWADAAPPGTKVVDGAWWQADETQAGGGHLAATGGPAGSEGWVNDHVCGAGRADRSRQWWR